MAEQEVLRDSGRQPLQLLLGLGEHGWLPVVVVVGTRLQRLGRDGGSTSKVVLGREVVGVGAASQASWRIGAAIVTERTAEEGVALLHVVEGPSGWGCDGVVLLLFNNPLHHARIVGSERVAERAGEAAALGHDVWSTTA